MAQESFEDKEVADALNRDYVALKVDREERPDVDSVYMNVCQAVTGHGGWPLTIIMTLDQKPFYAGTYLPKNSKYGMQGLLGLLNVVAERWKSDREPLIKSGNTIANFIRDQEVHAGEEDISKEHIELAVKMFSHSFDKSFGGFGSAPKFPTPHNLMFLLRYSQLTEDKLALKMVEKTLQSMYRGGIFDHIGYGFSRYSTDNKWLAPHFEKMLYDNALLTITYLETYQVTGNDLYKEIAIKTLQYISREMTSPEGGFYSAQDADSDGIEGKFYLFSSNEIVNLLGNDLGKLFSNRYDITEKGNFEGANIPNMINNPAYIEPDKEVEKILPKLLEYRAQRYSLHKDDKILTSWNALMIGAYAKAYQVTGYSSYLKTAEKAISFIENNLINESGTVHVSYRGSRSNILGFLDDYAFLAWAYLMLYEASFNAKYLESCVNITNKMSELFEDSQSGGFFLYGNQNETLITRPKDTYDGAMPSGNSVAAYVLSKLAEITGDTNFIDRSERQLSYLGTDVAEHPASHTFALIAAMSTIYPASQLVCAFPNEDNLIELKKLNKQFTANTSILVKTPSNENTISTIAPNTKEQTTIDNKPTFYLCKNRACSAPVHSLDDLL